MTNELEAKIKEAFERYDNRMAVLQADYDELWSILPENAAGEADADRVLELNCWYAQTEGEIKSEFLNTITSLTSAGQRQAWKALFQAEQRFMVATGNNRMCFECERLDNGCSGEKDKTYTACAMKVVKESEERKEVKRCHEQISKLNVDGS